MRWQLTPVVCRRLCHHFNGSLISCCGHVVVVLGEMYCGRDTFIRLPTEANLLDWIDPLCIRTRIQDLHYFAYRVTRTPATPVAAVCKSVLVWPIVVCRTFSVSKADNHVPSFIFMLHVHLAGASGAMDRPSRSRRRSSAPLSVTYNLASRNRAPMVRTRTYLTA